MKSARANSHNMRLACAVVVFICSMMLGAGAAYYSYLDNLDHQATSSGHHAVRVLEQVISLAQRTNQDALPLLDKSCDDTLPILRTLAAFKPLLRSVNLARNGQIDCYSLLGPQSEPDNDATFRGQMLVLLKENRARAHVPVLLVRTERGHDTVISGIDGETLQFMLDSDNPNVRIWLHIGNHWLDRAGHFSDQHPRLPTQGAYEEQSSRYPLSIYTGFEIPSIWQELWSTRYLMFGFQLFFSLCFATFVYWLLGQARSPGRKLVQTSHTSELEPHHEQL